MHAYPQNATAGSVGNQSAEDLLGEGQRFWERSLNESKLSAQLLLSQLPEGRTTEKFMLG